jgi:hypothetical protein
LDESSDRQWGPSFGTRVGITHDHYPIYAGAVFIAHLGRLGHVDERYDEKKRVYGPASRTDFISLQLGAEIGYELRIDGFILRPSAGIGLLNQNWVGDIGHRSYAVYLSPGVTGIWDGGVLLGLDVRPVIGLSDGVQPGLALAVCIGRRFEL